MMENSKIERRNSRCRSHGSKSRVTRSMVSTTTRASSSTSITSDDSASSSGSEAEFLDIPTNDDVVPSFSFSGCGFLGVYHVGVAACLREHTDVVNRPEIKVAGASAGALVATTMLCGMNFGEMTKILLDVAKAVREKQATDLGGQLRKLLDHYLPEDAHIKLSNRLTISTTVVTPFMECGLATNFESREQLMECLIATSFVPGFLGWIPPSIHTDAFVGLGGGIPEEDEEEEIKRHQRMQRGQYVDPQEKSYIKSLIELCFKSLNTTTRVVRMLPIASTIMDNVIPRGLGTLDDFVEILISELYFFNKYMAFDGGFSDNIPIFNANTITICPFAGESDICPRDLTGLDISFDLGGTSMQASEDNIFRLSHALNPMEPAMLQKLCEQGYNDCLRYLHKKDLLCCKQHLMTRATLHSSPCNIGHAHCKCDVCRASDEKIRVSLSCVECQKTKKKALVSRLPSDVQKEFQRAINSHKRKKSHDAYWSRILSVLWWLVEKMYSGTVQLAELAVRFEAWLMHFMDNFALIINYALLPEGKKRQFVRQIISSLHRSLSTAIQPLMGVIHAT